MVDKFHWLFAGPERYMFEAAEELERAGHEIVYFSMHDERNVPSPYSKYFVSNIDYGRGDAPYRLRNAPRIVGKTIYSFESRRKMAALLRDTRPDIAHLHMIDHQISPSILHALRDANVPVVQTIHDYKLVCPANSLFHRRTGRVCERCLGGHYYNCCLHRCTKNSLPASTLAMLAAYIHKAMRIYEKHVDLFLTSSDFLTNKLVEGGVPRDKIRKCHLSSDLSSFKPVDELGDYIVYAGRVILEKGLGTLVRAVAKVPRSKLVIIGEGDARPELERIAAQVGATNVEFAGYKLGDEFVKLLAQSRGMVLPSELYETCGLVVWEAYAVHRPAIVARIGGAPEFVDDGETGFLFEPGNVEDLAHKVGRLFGQESQRIVEMGSRGRAKVEAICEGHYDRLMAVYEEAMSKS